MKKMICIILALSLFVVTSSSTIHKGHDLSKVIYQYASAGSSIFFTNGKSTSLDKENSQTQKDYRFTIHANKEQLKKINELKGKKMTRLEFFEAVFPDIVAKLSDRQKSFMRVCLTNCQLRKHLSPLQVPLLLIPVQVASKIRSRAGNSVPLKQAKKPRAHEKNRKWTVEKSSEIVQ